MSTIFNETEEEKKKRHNYIFQCTLFILCSINSITKEKARKAATMFIYASKEESRKKYGITRDYLKTSKGLSPIVTATKNNIDKHDKRFLETVNRENKTNVEGRYADLLDFTDEKIAPFVDALQQSIYRTMDEMFPSLVDKRFITDVFIAAEMTTFNEMMFDLLSKSYSVMKENPVYSLFRMHKLNEQMVKILQFLDVRDEEGNEVKINITEILFNKVAIKILDDLVLFLLSSEYTDYVQRIVNDIDPMFRKESMSIVSELSPVTLPMIAYKSRYEKFDYDKFVEKYIA